MKRIFLLVLICIIPVFSLYSQSRKVKQATKKQEKQESSRDKDIENQRDAILKHRYNIQTKEVKARMKSSKKKASQFNKQNNKPFYKDLFKRKKKRRK